ncbi:surface-adhesin E family protein [Moraxella boevrei]|uniref:surface-adhesin E family protein n=1 Tax=Faucicola boevrei TaxID=346665 RepID=UPI003734E698
MPDGRVYSSETTLNYFDCNYRKWLMVEQHRYYNGGVIWSAKTQQSLFSSQNWHTAIPNSIGEALLDEACTSYSIMKNQ